MRFWARSEFQCDQPIIATLFYRLARAAAFRRSLDTNHSLCGKKITEFFCDFQWHSRAGRRGRLVSLCIYLPICISKTACAYNVCNYGFSAARARVEFSCNFLQQFFVAADNSVYTHLARRGHFTPISSAKSCGLASSLGGQRVVERALIFKFNTRANDVFVLYAHVVVLHL